MIILLGVHFEILNVLLGPTYSFRKTHSGKNCPEHEIITTEGMCSIAAKELGIIYKHSDSDINRPAGCHFSEDGVIFNEILLPENTNPEQFGDTGGIYFVKGFFCTLSFFRIEKIFAIY